MYSSLSDLIFKKRNELKMSLRDLSNATGLSHSYLSNLERGHDPRNCRRISPTVDAMYKLSKGLNVHLYDVINIVVRDIEKDKKD